MANLRIFEESWTWGNTGEINQILFFEHKIMISDVILAGY